MKKTLYTVFFFIGCGMLASLVFAVDQIKTNEAFILSSTAPISSATSTPFTVYIGDTLTGVTSPAVKSIYFIVSGVASSTTGDTLTINIDGVPATSKSFTLPTITLATPPNFEFIYNDTSNYINPSSSGAYTYTLNIIPAGATVYGLSVKMVESHRFAPPACADGASTNQKIKTTDSLVYSSSTPISATTAIPFNFYIGDNLAGVTDPLKSLYFTVSAVATSTAAFTVTIDINGDPATSQVFAFPAVASPPAPLDFIYKDPSNFINPTSAGSYSYVLNITPSSGLLLYIPGVKMTETHRYAPPSCGGMPILGDLISAVFDSTGSTDGGGYNSVMWTGTLGGPGTNEGKVRFQFAGADSPAGPWSYIGGATCAVGDWFDPGAPNVAVELIGTGANAAACRTAWNNKRYFRYKVEICSNDCTTAGTYTPTVNNVIVNWTP